MKLYLLYELSDDLRRFSEFGTLYNYTFFSEILVYDEYVTLTCTLRNHYVIIIPSCIIQLQNIESMVLFRCSLVVFDTV